MTMMRYRPLDFTKNGECSGCGNCCSNLLPLSASEIEKIRKYVKAHGVSPQPRTKLIYRSMIADLLCPFCDVTQELKCTIYPVRPQICRAFVCNRTLKDFSEADKELMSEKRYPHDMYQTFFGGDKK